MAKAIRYLNKRKCSQAKKLRKLLIFILLHFKRVRLNSKKHNGS